MPSAKRERQREGRQVRVAAAMAEQRRRQRIRSVRNFGIIVLVIVGVIVFLAWRSGSDKNPVTTSASSAPSSSAAPTPVAITIPAPGASITGATACPPADGSAARTTTFAQPPPMCIDPAKTYAASVATTKGTFSIALDAANAPNTVNNFVVLARYHYFDGVAFHRIIPGFVDQVGDANGPTPGQGGPGYTFADELPKDPSPYTEGAVAMANSGANTNGSQWFVVIGNGGAGLGIQYSKFGTIQAGLDVAKAINAAGTQAGEPTEEIKINAVTITET
jgi:cyclophilin family peptidyl-prolyl cis-trans isomerase